MLIDDMTLFLLIGIDSFQAREPTFMLFFDFFPKVAPGATDGVEASSGGSISQNSSSSVTGSGSGCASESSYSRSAWNSSSLELIRKVFGKQYFVWAGRNLSLCRPWGY
jgi:hypothetical protein